MGARATSPRSRAKGFTLVEILVVIALVSLLATLLLSVFGSVRSSARTATCASNLRQIYLATTQYADDHRGYYPVSLSPNSDCGWAEVIYPYLKSTAIFHCPSFSHGEFRPGCPPSDTSEGTLEDQAYNWDGSYSKTQLGPGKIYNQKRVRHPDHTVLYFDGYGKRSNRDIRNVDGTFGGTVTIGGGLITNELLLDFSDLGNRHHGGANCAFADGHIKWLSFESMRDPSLWRPD